MADVFISYATKDTYFADELCEKLEKNGISCWYSPRNCSADKPYSLQISNAIKECKVYIVLVSYFSNDSEHVKNEVNLAFNDNKEIICYRLVNVKPSDDLNYYLGRKRWIDCTGDDKGALEVVSTVQKLIVGKIPVTTVFQKLFRFIKKIFWLIVFAAIIFTLTLIVKDVTANPALWKSRSIAEYFSMILDLLKGFNYAGTIEKISEVVKTLLGK